MGEFVSTGNPLLISFYTLEHWKDTSVMISLNMCGGKLKNQERQNDHNNNGLQESFFFL